VDNAANILYLRLFDFDGAGRAGWVGSTGFGPFEKPSAPAFSVHAEIRALSSYFGVYTGYATRRVKLSGFGAFGNVLQNSISLVSRSDSITTITTMATPPKQPYKTSLCACCSDCGVCCCTCEISPGLLGFGVGPLAHPVCAVSAVHSLISARLPFRSFRGLLVWVLAVWRHEREA
jgi:hypothetical protein